MGIREMIADRPVVGYAIAVIVLVIAATAVLRSGQQTSAASWWYDVDAGELISLDGPQAQPPITLDNGHTAVRAYVYACGNCEDNPPFIGMLERIDAAAATATPERPGAGSIVDPGAGTEVAVPAEDGTLTWVPANSPAGMQIAGYTNMKCPDPQMRAARCSP